FAVVRDLLGAHFRQHHWLERGGGCRGCRRSLAGSGAAVGRARVAERQIQREGAAAAGNTAQADLAAEQVGELAAGREAEAGAAVLARGARIPRAGGLDKDALLLR